MSTAHPSARTRERRRRPLAAFANGSPLHAFGVWLLKSAMVAVLFLAVWLLITNWAVPALVEGMQP